MDDHDRLSLRQRAGLRNYKPRPQNDDGFFWLFIALMLGMFLLAFIFALFGCDANALKIVWAKPEPIVTTQSAIPSRTHFENTQKLAREAAKESEQTLTKLEKWEGYAEIGIPILVTLYGFLKTYNALKRRKGRAA